MLEHQPDVNRILCCRKKGGTTLKKTHYLIFKLQSIPRFAFLCFLLLTGGLTTNSTMAQNANDIQSVQRQVEILQQQEQQRISQDQKEFEKKIMGSEGLNTDELIPKINFPDKNIACRQISKIIISGAKNLPESTISKITEKYSNQCLDVIDIEKILTELTK